MKGTSLAFNSVNTPIVLALVTLCPGAILTLLKLPVKGAISCVSSISLICFFRRISNSKILASDCAS
ncbi:MAG: hypothetical protein CM15mP117_20290 [Alphaproteobacteria bacterium]|nr:MAG: hypothetical protein CM15mP117_20290 [Alphaproteobacteria bacterium]